MKQQIKHFVFLWLLLPVIFGKMLAQNLQTNTNSYILNVNYHAQGQENAGNNPEASIQNDFYPAQQAVNLQQGEGWASGWFGKEECDDCEEVKAAVKTVKISSGSAVKFYRKHRALKRWKKFTYDFNLKMKRVFARTYKAKTLYSDCFKWTEFK